MMCVNEETKKKVYFWHDGAETNRCRRKIDQCSQDDEESTCDLCRRCPRRQRLHCRRDTIHWRPGRGGGGGGGASIWTGQDIIRRSQAARDIDTAIQQGGWVLDLQGGATAVTRARVREQYIEEVKKKNFFFWKGCSMARSRTARSTWQRSRSCWARLIPRRETCSTTLDRERERRWWRRRHSSPSPKPSGLKSSRCAFFSLLLLIYRTP